jgi:hypothetical protein
MFRTATSRILLVLYGVACACSGPREVVGPGDPHKLKGGSKPVSVQFGPGETRQLHQQITSPEFRRALATYTCGDPVPNFTVTLAFWPERTYNDRLIFIYTDPNLFDDSRNLCLALGFEYDVVRALRRLDVGPPMTYKTTAGVTITASRPALNRPICDCARSNAKAANPRRPCRPKRATSWQGKRPGRSWRKRRGWAWRF